MAQPFASNCCSIYLRHILSSFPLSQVHSEYNKCIKQANKLERHLIKARARAAATEREAYGKIREEMGDVQDHQGLFVGELDTLTRVDRE